MDDSLLLRVVDEASAYQLPALIAEWAAATDHRRWIAKALRIDLALLTERPELVVPCLYRRCATVGVLEAGFASRPEVPAAMAELRDWIGGAVEAWSVGKRWLRALRSPPVPLDGAVVEEYRTSARGKLWCSDDGQRIGVASEDGIVAWERATGRRVEAEAGAVRGGAWKERTRDSTWGSLVLEREGERATIAYRDDAYVRWVSTLSDRYVFVSGDDLDDEPFHGVVDTRRAALVWARREACAGVVGVDDARCMVARSGTIDIVAIATGDVMATWNRPYDGMLCALPDGNVDERFHGVVDARRAALVWAQPEAYAGVVVVDDARCMMARGGAIDIVAIATGDVEATWNCPYGGALRALPDGNVAVLNRDVLRVWDPVLARAPQVIVDLAESCVAAAFSPDATRLITGGLLCDAQTGQRIARIACNSPGWRWGAPSVDVQRLCDGVFAEIQPLGLTLWDARDGATLAQHRDVRRTVHDAAAFDPAGRYLAMLARGQLSVRRLPDAAIVWEGVEPVSEPYVVDFGFSSDGETLVWNRPDGTWWALAMLPDAAPQRIANDARAAPPASRDVEAGLLTIDGVAIPCDDATVVLADDGLLVAGRHSHYRLEHR